MERSQQTRANANIRYLYYLHGIMAYMKQILRKIIKFRVRNIINKG